MLCSTHERINAQVWIRAVQSYTFILLNEICFALYALVVVIGDQGVPTISTQALKQQHEKNIEEATPSKQVKVMKVHDHTIINDHSFNQTDVLKRLI